MSTTKHVRLKPHNPKRGHVMRKYTHVASGKKFEEAAGWYRVDAGLADYLETVRQISSDPESAGAFDVCTESEAKAIDIREKRAKEARALAGTPNDLTTNDLRRESSFRAAAESESKSPAHERMRARETRDKREVEKAAAAIADRKRRGRPAASANRRAA